MMSDGYYTREPAQNVANAVKYLIEHPGDKRHFVVRLVKYLPGGTGVPARQRESQVAVRLLDDLPNVIPLASGGEIVRCITQEEKRVDIIFGHPDTRSVEPALVLLEE